MKQRRSIQSPADRGRVSFETVHSALGNSGERVKQFIVQQSEEDAEIDDVQIALSRASTSEFSTILARLEAMPGVRECRHEK